MESISVEISSVSTEPVAEPGPRFKGAIHAGSAVIEQGTFSLSNWLLQACLVRWLAHESEFGAFSVAFAWFLLAGAVHNALIIEPMMVYGGKRFSGQIRQYFGALTGGSLGVSVVVAVILAGVGLGYAAGGQRGVAVACWSLAGATPFVFLSWLMRRTSYVTRRPHRSALAGLGYLVAMVGGFILLRQTERFTVPTAVAVMAVASLGAAIWLILSEQVAPPTAATDTVTGRPLTACIREDHWRFGRWMMLSGLSGILAAQWFFLVLPWFTGVEAGGALRALTNLFQPVTQTIIAFTAILVPVLVGAAGTPRYRQLVRGATLVMAGGPLVAWLVCGLVSGWLVELIYSGRYLDDAPLLWLIGLQPVAAGLMAVRHAELCVADRPDRMFAATAASLLFTLTGGTALMYAYGLWGVAAAVLAAMVVDVAVAQYFVRTGLSPCAGPRASHAEAREETLP